jgi:hypothetical protein
MKRRTVSRSLVLLAAAGIVVAACGSDDKSESTTAAPTTAASATSVGSSATTSAGSTAATTGGSTAATTGGSTAATTGGTGATGGAVDLSACPNPIVVQTDWFPESEHGALYELVGQGYKVDTDKKVLRGPLVVGGKPTGVDIEIRTGGPSIGDQTVAGQTYADDSITLAYANTESQVLQHGKTPLLSVVAPLERNPQIIYWDPATYPDVKTLADLGTKGVTINVFGGGVFSDVFVAEGIWKKDQIDPSYNGAPDRFISEDGKIAQQGFASAEPYLYQNEFKEWGKPLAYQLLDDAGFKVYSQTLAIRPDDKAKLAPCLKHLVPVVQQAAIDFVNDPARANAIILDAVKQYDTFWTYSQGVADYSVKTQKELGLVGNGSDATLGNMDGSRIQTVIDQMRTAKLDFAADLKADDLFTNEFIDPSIGMK